MEARGWRRGRPGGGAGGTNKQFIKKTNKEPVRGRIRHVCEWEKQLPAPDIKYSQVLHLAQGPRVPQSTQVVGVVLMWTPGC